MTWRNSLLNKLLIVAALLAQCASEDDIIIERLSRLRILGLFPYRKSPWNGEYVIPAARLARDEINRNNSILPGYELELIEADSGCNRDDGVREFVNNALLLNNTHQLVAILGAGCSSSTIPIASITGRDDVLLPQLSYGATSLFLSMTSSYPYFYRTVPTDGSTTEAIIRLVEKFNWKCYGVHNAGVGTSNQILADHAITTVRVGMQRYISESMEVYSGRTNRDSSFADQSAFTEDIHSAGMRVGMMYGVRGTVGEMMCHLYRHKLTYPYVIWILTNNGGDWYNTAAGDCSVGEIRQATHGIIHFDYLLTTSRVDDVIDVTNKTFDQYYQSYINEARKYANETGDDYTSSLLNDWATVAYDSMWTLGLALHKAEEKLSQHNSSLADFILGNRIISATILRELASVKFSGSSGKIFFDETHKRPVTITITQVQNGMLKTIGLYHPSSDRSMLGDLDLNESELLWSVDNPPPDMFESNVLLAHTWAGILMMIFLVIGFVWNSFSMLINFRYQDFYTIKASSPQLNYMIFAGNNLLLLSGVLLVVRAIEKRDMVTFSTLCQITQWLFDLGLLLVLNITLLKSWRIYRIFYSFRRKPGKLITDNTFIAASIGWILINTAYHIVFVLVNKSSFGKERFLRFEENQVCQKVVYCLPPNIIVIFYIPHVAMAVILCLLAFLIRQVHHKQFNDAKNVAIFFYATIPIATICLTLSALLSPVNDIYNLATVSLILDCTAVCCIVYMCQLTLFVPKMLPLFRHLQSH